MGQGSGFQTGCCKSLLEVPQQYQEVVAFTGHCFTDYKICQSTALHRLVRVNLHWKSFLHKGDTRIDKFQRALPTKKN